MQDAAYRPPFLNEAALPVMLNAVKHLAFRPLAIAFLIDPGPSPRLRVAPRATPSAARLD